MGRHHTPGEEPASKPRGRIAARAALGLALVGVLIAGLLAIVGGKVSPCDHRDTFTVMADPALASAARAEAGRASDRCTTFTVREVADAKVAGTLAGGGDTPDLWLAPTRNRVDIVGAQLGRELPNAPVASSPLVLAGAKIPQPGTWLEALTSATIRALPADSAHSEAPVAAAVSESQRPGADQQALTVAVAQYAQAAKRVTGEPVSAAAAEDGVVVVPEYAFIAAQKAGGAIAATVPKTGAPRDELVLAVTAPADRADAARTGSERLASAFTSPEGRDALAGAGLRGVDLTPEPEGGVGTVARLPDPDRAQLARAVQAFTTLAVPLRALVVVDTSGSMAEKAGNVTRIQMLANGFAKVVTQIPDANSVGLWTFSMGRGGGPDWTEVVATARLDTPRGDTSQRQALLDGVNGLPAKVAGGTGLYDTTLAAYQRAVQGFDPAYSNSLILLTDGGNEKNGGLDLDGLVTRLNQLVDPARPVNIHTVGISKDADLPALKRIADATGGTAQSAETEEQMLTDFVTAVAKRAK
ncbi:VWA domain-containing protein [Tsukamurella sp. 1534]|uniref:VWA domain-containing protein n=1 Tax=Tsukamurella sp. 1534 TaxID=1151061 RepID=UPI0002EC3F5E|nr:VWA domain-containing protein [Tsukamurella sp. 1534]